MPLRSPKMNSFIFGFQRLVWCPKCTPASSRSLMLTLVAGGVLGVVVAKKQPPRCFSPVGPSGAPGLSGPSSPRGSRSTLAELEAATGALLPVLLPLLGAGVPGEESRLLELAPQLEVEHAEGPRDAVAQGPRLGGDPAAVQGGQDVEFLVGLGQRERLLDQHLQGFMAAEVLVERLLVQGHLARAGAQVDPCDRGLALARPVILDGSRKTAVARVHLRPGTGEM